MPDMLTKQEKIQQIKEFFNKTKLDPNVTKITLNKEYSHVSPDLLKDASEKLLKIHKGEVEEDDRDNLLFSKFHGLEDFVHTHIDRDAGKLNAKAKMKMEQKKNLDWLHAGFWSPQLRSILVSNVLTQMSNGINPLNYYNEAHKVTKMGEGGLPSTDSIPSSSHQVQDSSFGFFCPFQQSEDLSIGVTNFFTHGTRKGDDNKLYKLVLDNQGVRKWIDHETLLRSNVEIPNY
jgi:DNA-directed RNA polymerase beta subunit